MKAVIVEIRNNQASLLTDDGCVKTVKNKNYKIGQVILMSSLKKFNMKKISAIAGSAAAFILLGAGTFAYANPYTYVSVDVNPSIEYTLNRFDRVIKVTAVNDDGEDILNQISINMENQSISDAIENTVEQISKAGYFDGEEPGGIVITTSCEDSDKADTLATELKQTVEQQTADAGEDVEVETYRVGAERVKEARALGVTPGKLNLVEKLQKTAGDSVNYDTKEWLSKPVKDIMKETKRYSNDVVDSDEDADIEDQDEKDSLLDMESDDDINSNESNEKSGKEKKSHKKTYEYDMESDDEDSDFEDDEDNNSSQIQDSEETDEESVSEQAKVNRENAKKAAERARERAKKEAEQAKERAEKESERAKKQLEENDSDEDQDNKVDSENNSDYEDDSDYGEKQNDKQNYEHEENDNQEYEED